jgi:hypothetical protein
MAENIGNLPAEGSVDCCGESGLELCGKRNVRKSDAFTCEEGMSSKMSFEDGEGGSQTILKYGVDLEGRYI